MCLVLVFYALELFWSIAQCARRMDEMCLGFRNQPIRQRMRDIIHLLNSVSHQPSIPLSSMAPDTAWVRE